MNSENNEKIEKLSAKPTNKDVLRHYICSLVLYGFALMLFYFNPWFKNFLTVQFINIDLTPLLGCLYLFYLILAPIIFFIIKPKDILNSENVLILNYFKKLFTFKFFDINTSRQQIIDFFQFIKPNSEEAKALFWYFSRLYFLPVMISMTANFLIMGIDIFTKLMFMYSTYVIDPVRFIGYSTSKMLAIYRDSILLCLFFFTCAIEAGVYSLSYFVNCFCKVKSVDMSAFGVISCLCCYIPFKSIVDIFIIPYPENITILTSLESESAFTWLISIVIYLLCLITICSMISLFLRASNLSNRGIVTKFPYNIVRHPLYSAKIVFIWTMIIYIISIQLFSNVKTPENIVFGALVYGFCYTLIYFFRAVTEERHLYVDDEYKKYCEKVKYRFIFKVW